MTTKPRLGLVASRRRLRAREFLDELGKLMYSTAWNSSYIRHVEKNPPNNLKGYTESVDALTHLIQAMSLGIGMSEIELTDRVISQLFSSNQPALDIGDDFSEAVLWTDEPECPLPTPIEGFYAIDPEYWTDQFDHDAIDWQQSTISIPSEYIQFKDIRHKYKHPEPAKTATARLYISNPDTLLSRTLEIPPLPTPKLINRYLAIRCHVRLELIAATWRSLTIKRISHDDAPRGLQADLVKELQEEYIKDHLAQPTGESFGTADSTIRALVKNVLEQWREGNIKASVLVSSKARSVPPDIKEG